MDGADTGAASVRSSGAARERSGEPVYGPDDGSEPGAGDAADHQYAESGRVKAAPYRRSEVRRPVTRGGHGTAGVGGRGARKPERAGDAEDTVARVSANSPGRVRAAGGHFRGAYLQLAQLGAVPQAEHQLPRPGPRRSRSASAASRGRGRPGYLRMDTVHQGDQDGVKGVYHINAVDEVTQWQMVAAAPQISEAWLEPLLEHAGTVSVPHSRFSFR